ncbi:hypothetical protein [Lentzea tibetensis]|uniref:hypothetical protein n=1 Tax=Lentzea tibetensis TaxID=2591470 RepID=UPI001F32EC91|nr:hypothetical protein [Lentzea tibetensis]
MEKKTNLRRVASTAGKTALGLASAVILIAAGVAWQDLTELTTEVTKQDVIAEETSTGERPPDGSLDVMLVGLDSRTDAKGNPLPQKVLRECRPVAVTQGPQHRHADHGSHPE